MRHLTFDDSGEYPITILVPNIRKDEIVNNYLKPWDINKESVMILDLHQAKGKKKTPVKEIKEYIETELVPVLNSSKSKYIVCADSEYFKVLTKSPKTEATLGYVLDSVYGSQKVVYVPNFSAIFYDPPKIRAKIAQGMDALVNYIQDTYIEPGTDIIHYADYPTTSHSIGIWLDKLLEMDVPLAIDIEAFSLKHYDAGIGTITFCWNKHEGIAFPVDYSPIEGATTAPYGEFIPNTVVRQLLREFFAKYLNRQIYHNISYDVYVMIYTLYMTDLLDTEGLLEGMDTLLRNWDDTKLITYLATNSCAGNELGLKKQAQEYAGNYAQDDIKDIRNIPLKDLLEYNLVDGLSTWFTYEKHWDTLVSDQQEDIYNTIFKPATLDIIQMQLTGIPLNMDTVKKVELELEDDRNNAMSVITNSPIIKAFHNKQAQDWVTERNSVLKVKRVTIADYTGSFNVNSGPQLQDLLFEFIELPVLGLTKSKQPATDGDTIKNLRNHTDNKEILDLLNAIMDFKLVDKILTNFIPAFRNARLARNGWHYLFGNLNLGGTVSGRLSASDPNLQTLPSGSKYAKKIKSCIEAPPGELFIGLDFDSLEDKISAVTTKDPNKIKVYTDGYDGHCLRAYYYFGEQMPDIVNTLESINSIAKLYEKLRSKSKAPTFALTYQGTYITLMKNCGFSEEEAKSIEKNYHELYVVSDQYIQGKLDQAGKDGYVTAAFGLRVRTPLLQQVIRGTRVTPYEAEAEGRTAGNALGQSWCLLNSRAASEFMGKVRTSEFRLTLKPSIHIHDAQYYVIRDDLEHLMYVNEHLVQAVNWQNHPDIYHPEVKLGGKLSVFYPTWCNDIPIPNYATETQILSIVKEAMSHV